MLWIFVSVATFTLSWNLTNGGYLCSIPLCLLLLLYVSKNMLCTSASANISTGTCKIFQEIESNTIQLVQSEKRSITLLLAYWSFKIIALYWYPYVEKSNGSPLSLVFFTCAFLTLYIIPSLLGLVLFPFATFCQWKWCLSYSIQCKKGFIDSVQMIRNQNKVIIFVSIIVTLLFIFDGDITSLIRYTMKSKPCWPILISRSNRGSLPYPLQHAWIKTWHFYFRGYVPGSISLYVQHLGRELGEVCRLLPVLIGVYAMSQFVLHRYSKIRRTLFACVAGVVLGGVTSGFFKILIHRYRPNAYGDPYKWTGPGTAVVNHLAFSKLDLSFPAGHTTVTSAVATSLYTSVIQSTCTPSITWRIGLALLLYSFPVAVLISRVGDCYHWSSDAAFGVCITIIL